MTATMSASPSPWVRSRPGWTEVARQEVADHLLSARFVVLLAILGLVAVGTVFGAANALTDAAQSASESGVSLFLRLFTVNAEPVPFSFMTFLGFLAPILGIAYGFDSISGEVARGTLPRLLSQPIHRDDVINGKFVGGLAVIGLIMLVILLTVAGLGILTLGITPSASDLLRLFAWYLATMAYVGVWLALATLTSVTMKGAATSAVVSIGIWLVLTLFGALLFQLAAGVLSPIDSDPLSALENARTEVSVSRVSPVVLYNDAAAALLVPEVRSLGIITIEQTDRTIPTSLSSTQSILLVWPQLVGLVAVTVVLFALAYILFMRREVRA